jgi:glycerophosphoryl diester phosphodiesterase
MTSTMSPAPEVDQLLAVPFAHRGLHSTNAPENSLAAFQRAIDCGIGIELDVGLSADGVPVVHHDATLDRMCAVPAAVSRMPAAALTRLRLDGTEHTLPSLAAAMHLVGGAVPVLVDLKAGLGRAERRRLIDSIAILLRSYRGSVGVVGFDPWLLQGMATQAPRVARGQSGGIDASTLRSAPLSRVVRHPVDELWTMRVSRPHFVSFNVARMPSASLVRARERRPVVAWTVRGAADFRLAQECADAVIVEDEAVELALASL